MAEELSIQSYGVKMLSLVEKLEDLKARLDNDIYTDVILQSLPPCYDPFIINYNMNGLEKSIHDLINMLVQYEAMTHKSALAVLVGEASISMAQGKRVGRWKRKKGYFFYDPSKEKTFVSRNAVFLKKGFPVDSRWDEVLLEEASEAPQQNDATSFEPLVPTDSVPVFCKLTRESRPPKRYRFVGLTS
ncbi:UNVERIFIED_CONTAM: hypothetical protein Scaly_3116700 [Sesamum calycinum]|uniref:Uncharacterized protein n=1 Tax=Sesamum calycinum TaxID=2727403 RepID=A0AAW2JKI5_9LAMI